jgi:hypothetical protein
MIATNLRGKLIGSCVVSIGSRVLISGNCSSEEKTRNPCNLKIPLLERFKPLKAACFYR